MISLRIIGRGRVKTLGKLCLITASFVITESQTFIESWKVY